MQTIISTYKQKVQTIHPDLIIEVPFFYKAVVHSDEGETVDVIEVSVSDVAEIKFLPIDKKTPSIERFLAYIREDARAKAYKLRKQNKVNHESSATN